MASTPEQESQHLEELRRNHQRRLHVLEVQQSKFGISTPPEVAIEILDIQAKLANIAAALVALQSPTSSARDPTVPRTEPIPAPKPPSLNATELRTLRQRAGAAFFARRWAEAEPLLSQLVATDSSDTEARTRLYLLIAYREVGELREIGDWEAVLGALDDLARQQTNIADPSKHRVWAEAQQRRDAAYERALVACERNDWATAQAALEVLLAEQPQDSDADALLQRVRAELAEQQRKAAESAAQKKAEEERQRKAAEATAQKKAEEERQRKAAEARARVIDPITTNLNKQAYANALDQLTALLKINPQDREAVGLVAGLIENTTVPLAERLQAGDLAGQYGDPRPGVVRFPPAMVAFAGGQFQYGNTQVKYDAIIAAEKQNNLVTQALDWYKPTINTQLATVARFELARYPVTNAQWGLFMDAGGYQPNQPWWDIAGRAWLARDDSKTAGLKDWQKRDRKDQPSFWDDARFGKDRPNSPVVGINWYESIAFCRWLTQHLNDGYIYTLPNELEWEYAARGRERRVYAWGNQPADGERANFNQAHKGTTAVGCFPTGATPEGLFDMAGNVWEWTRSEYRSYPYNPSDGREDGADPVNKRFTLRGGGWNARSVSLRASYRDDLMPVNRSNSVGFRLARHRK
jgi:formylglycine-generating enzyme required for sulfatase activity